MIERHTTTPRGERVRVVRHKPSSR